MNLKNGVGFIRFPNNYFLLESLFFVGFGSIGFGGTTVGAFSFVVCFGVSFLSVDYLISGDYGNERFLEKWKDYFGLEKA